MRVWSSICSAAFYLFLRLHLYRLKSIFFIWLLERERYVQYSVSVYRSLEDLCFALKRLQYTGDSWRSLFDAFSSPQRVEYLINHKTGEAAGDVDCDEFSRYIAEAVRVSKSIGYLPEVDDPLVLTVSWLQRNGVPGGHNVCLMKFPKEPPHRRWAYMDYGMPIHFPSVEGVVAGIVSRYNAKHGGGGALLGWAFTDSETLKPLKVVRA